MARFTAVRGPSLAYLQIRTEICWITGSLGSEFWGEWR
jgi:hypothetical protein